MPPGPWDPGEEPVGAAAWDLQRGGWEFLFKKRALHPQAWGSQRLRGCRAGGGVRILPRGKHREPESGDRLWVRPWRPGRGGSHRVWSSRSSAGLAG